MFGLSKLLVPVDLSANSLLAAHDAAALSARFHSQVTLLHVAEFPQLRSAAAPGQTVSAPVRQEFLAAMRRDLDEFAHEELAPGEHKRILCCGHPAKVIVDRAHAENAGLIVMSTHGYGPVRRLLLGSVTAKVLHDSDRPVWTTRAQNHEQRGALRVRRVMCAVNFRPQDAKTLRWAADFAAEFGAHLILIHAVRPAPPEMPERYAFTWHEEASWGADERMRTLAAGADVAAAILVVEGDAPSALARAARDNSADVLVIGRNEPTSMSGRLGEHTYAIVCHAPCPVVCL